MSFIVAVAAPTITQPSISVTNVTTTTAQINLTAPATGAPNLAYVLTVIINPGSSPTPSTVTYNVSTFPYTVTALASGTLHGFTLTAVDNAQNVYVSMPSAQVQATTGSTSSPPGAVTWNSVPAGVSTSEIDMSWNVASGATTYTVQRDGATLANGVTGSIYKDTGLAASSTHSYRVAGVNGAGTGSFSPLLSATTFSANPSFGVKITNGKWTDLNGNPIQFQGSNFGGLETNFAPQRWAAFYNTSVAQWKSIATNWKLNIFRFPLDAWSWRVNPSVATNGGQKTYQQIVKQCFDNVTAAGVNFIADNHWSCPNNVNGGKAIGQPGFMDTDNAPAFMTSLAALCKNYANCIMEPFNEPFGDNNFNNNLGATQLAILKNGTPSFFPFVCLNNIAGGTQTTNVNYGVAGNQQLLNAVRSGGFTGPVIYGKPWFNGEIEHDADVRPTDSLGQLGSAHHQYGWGAPPKTVASNQTFVQAVLNVNIPILVTEFDSEISYIGGYSYCRSKGIGFVVWGPNNYSGTANSASTFAQYITTPVWSVNGSPAFQ